MMSMSGEGLGLEIFVWEVSHLCSTISDLPQMYFHRQVLPLYRKLQLSFRLVRPFIFERYIWSHHKCTSIISEFTSQVKESHSLQCHWIIYCGVRTNSFIFQAYFVSK